MNINYLENHILAPQYSTVFIGGTTYNTGRVKTRYNGLWEGYKNGENILEISFGYTEGRNKFAENIYAQLRGLEILFRNAYKLMDENTLILVSNQRIVKWMENGQYKWMDKLGLKANLFSLFDIIKPKIAWYNSLEPPFSLINEHLTIEKKELDEDIKNSPTNWTYITKR